MNARDYKIFRAGYCYHIYNRGNNKESIFIESQDYFVFLNRLKLILGLSKIPFGQKGQRESLTMSDKKRIRIRIKPLPANAFSILCYCLMPNHFHFIIQQNALVGIDKLVTKLCTSYAKYFNLKYERVGNVFQDAFKAKLVEGDSYLKYLSAYIHNNPDNPLEYDYSSLKDYLDLRQGQICDKSFILGMFGNNSEAYKKFVLDFSESNIANLKPVLFEE